ncbi:hypothetical protein DFJ77DRAFT_212352 [Powellomyces hirtus]|nr:hypothetical protein DFJ77DRAFT_212352 [Powellomyces hirtus]
MWKGAPLGSRTSQPSTGFLEIDFDVNEFSVILQDMKLTKHAIIAIWDYTGSMFAVSQAGQLHDGKSAVPTTYTAEAHPLEDISVPASSMKAKFGSYENYPETYAETYTTSAGVLLTNVVKIEKYGARWFILISIPETDITGPLVAARKKLIITSSVVGVVMLGFAAGLSVLVTMPLRRLSAIMVQATGMDFSSLSQGYLKKKNPISEIAAMQEIFSNMLDRFAKAIQSNKELQSRPMTTSGIKSKRSDSVA